MRYVLILLILIAALAGGALYLTRPIPVAESRLSSLSGDAAAGELVFYSSGCSSCHLAPESEDPMLLAGGQRFATEFGTFVAPNISSHPEQGLGSWTQAQFASAVLEGVSPEGAHYYPAFPYSSYTRMSDQDVVDLWAFMQTLPASDAASQPHELALPFQFRQPLGIWKALYVTDGWRLRRVETPEVERGRYLVEALGHCGECHTERNLLGALDQDTWLAGAPNPSGQGRIPAIHPDRLNWSDTDIAYYLETGFTPDFDSAGGSMAAVVRNYAKLPPEDRAAVAAYLKALP